MKNLIKKLTAASMAVIISTTSLSGCGELFFGYKQAREKVKEPASYSFPLSEKETIHGMTSYPANTQSDPNKRDIFRRLEEQTNVHVDWKAIPSDQWGDKISLQMTNYSSLPDFVFTAGFSDTDLQRYGNQGIIIPLEDYIDKYMPNLKKVFDEYPE